MQQCVCMLVNGGDYFAIIVTLNWFEWDPVEICDQVDIIEWLYWLVKTSPNILIIHKITRNDYTNSLHVIAIQYILFTTD